MSAEAVAAVLARWETAVDAGNDDAVIGGPLVAQAYAAELRVAVTKPEPVTRGFTIRELTTITSAASTLRMGGRHDVADRIDAAVGFDTRDTE